MSGQFRLKPGIPHPGDAIFKRVDRIDHVVQGRSSRIADNTRARRKTKQATAVQPENVEAWANLALPTSVPATAERDRRRGRSAAPEPTHYYVHLGLARAFAGVQRWPESVRRRKKPRETYPARRTVPMRCCWRGAAHSPPEIPGRDARCSRAGRSCSRIRNGGAHWRPTGASDDQRSATRSHVDLAASA